MEDTKKIISGNTEQDVWSVIEEDLSNTNDVLNYDAVIRQGDKEVQLYIDIDLGGGFEGGSEFTQLLAPLPAGTDFRFAIHEEHFVDEIGKFFGMQDIATGYPDLDKHVIIKANNEETVKRLFADEDVRNVVLQLTEFDFGIHSHTIEDTDEKVPCLELNIDEGITDQAALRRIYHAFYAVLQEISR